MTSYKIIHSHGQTEYGYETLEAAESAVRSVYGAGCEIGHPGDLSDGGESTLVWRDAEQAQDDDGSRAVARIRITHEVAS